jgi:hypothetical protein
MLTNVPYNFIMKEITLTNKNEKIEFGLRES